MTYVLSLFQPINGEKQYSTVTVVTVQYYCHSVICLLRTRISSPPDSLTINLRVIQCTAYSLVRVAYPRYIAIILHYRTLFR